jgi:hypothetical protein
MQRKSIPSPRKLAQEAKALSGNPATPTGPKGPVSLSGGVGSYFTNKIGMERECLASLEFEIFSRMEEIGSNHKDFQQLKEMYHNIAAAKACTDNALKTSKL